MDGRLQQLLQVLNRLYKESEHVYGKLASKQGMTDTAFWVLYAITHAEGPLTQNDLCNGFFFPVQTIHSAIGKLHGDGLLDLQVIPGAKNRKAIILTEKGKAFAAATISKADEIEKNALLYFSAEERKLYLSLFKRHIEYLKSEEKRVLDLIPEQGGNNEPAAHP